MKEAQAAKRTLGDGVTFDIAVKDAQQRLRAVSDGANHRRQLLRDPLTVLNHRQRRAVSGPVLRVHNVRSTRAGKIYTVETSGARVQKFTYKGQGPVATPEGNHN